VHSLSGFPNAPIRKPYQYFIVATEGMALILNHCNTLARINGNFKVLLRVFEIGRLDWSRLIELERHHSRTFGLEMIFIYSFSLLKEIRNYREGFCRHDGGMFFLHAILKAFYRFIQGNIHAAALISFELVYCDQRVPNICLL